ncbi:SPOR domain-containing protein [Paenibacillus sacheonensis]|uniref:SPOR domain-containing protein n=1 Tax=Paenibacillus sacheonensis TaxID=742054 RepID=A0A7X4YK51_9BACL|nr:SPOR domain-containing protein [Paenibacillus sacheonensis]MBM7563781.1 hypothetical protein [Paenibacillus sacheonensis]NBC67867.1 hypothetical protein [Paenibacillus sacheonensis]
MSAKGRITYRFDKQSGAREELPRQERQRASDTNAVPYFQEELSFTADIGSWNSPFQNDAHALEQLIRESDGQLPKTGSKPRPGGSRSSLEPADYSAYASSKTQPTAPTEADLPPMGDTGPAILLGDEETDQERSLHAYSKRVSPPQVIDMYPLIDVVVDRYDNNEGRRGSNKAFVSPVSGTGKRPAQGPSWFKVFASVAGAIATGALFGYFVLTLFTGGGPSGSANNPDAALPAVSSGTAAGNPSAAGTANGGKGAAAAGDKNADKNAASTVNAGTAKTVKVDVPAASYYMLQYGVFSSKDGLDAAAAELHGKGLAAASLTSQEDFRIYVGMSTDRDAADLLGQTLTGMDVYVKQIELPALSAMPYKGAASDVQAFFENTSGLLAKLDSMTLDRLIGQSDADAVTQWQALHEKWTASASRLEAGLTSKTDQDTLRKLEQAMNTAAVAAGEYVKKPSDAYLWSMQTALMNAVFIQKGWFESIESL